MTLRTPRRRVSPRTRKRYRAIKDFFKRAIGSTSQPDIEINSNIAVNVTDLKHKIVGLEQQLSEVSRTCREYIYLNGSTVGSQISVSDSLSQHSSKRIESGRELRQRETTILYQNSESHCGKSDGSDDMPKHNKKNNNTIKSNTLINVAGYDINDNKTKIKNSKLDIRVKDLDMKQNFSKPHIHSAHKEIRPVYSIANIGSHAEFREIHHCNPGYSGDQAESRAHKREQNDHTHRSHITHNEQLLQRDNEYRSDKHSNYRKHQHRTNELDKDFIADIIQRQYKPMKMFGRRASDLSQFSEPLCRDRERTIEDDIHEDTKLCSCCYGRQNCPKIVHRRHADSDTRSVCDTRLYSSKMIPRHKHRRPHTDAYNSELYDLVPVKEKTSPKSRKKIAYENLANCHSYREVPPSPRTHRPRLNLKAQHYTEEDHFTNTAPARSRRVSPKRQPKYQKPRETFDSDTSMPIPQASKNKQQKIVSRQHQGTMSSLHHVDTEVTDTVFNRTQEAVSSADKTDQALCEIKDILQTFLEEIKKEASTSGKSDVSTKTADAKLAGGQDPSANIGVNSTSFNNYSAPQCNIPSTPFMPPYMNPCCYPVMPMYPVSPISCMQNGYTVPSQSFTCGCPNKPDEPAEISKTNTGNETLATETDELIKEIYKYVAHSPTFSRKQEVSYETKDCSDKKCLTSRSAGGSGPVCQHNAKVGTMATKCYSKSCEAMGSRILADAYDHYNETTPSYSDTILESLETTAISSSKTELSTERSDEAKKTKLSKVLKSFGLFKKKQEEKEFESESTIEVDIKKKAPYRQEVTNYAVHSQEYYRPPPVSRDHRYFHQESLPSATARDQRSCRHQDYHSHEPREYHPPYSPIHYPPHGDTYHESRIQQTRSPQYHPSHPIPPPCAYEHYNQMQPQIPLCLKEIEVKTMGTQSERKISFFNKMKKKIQTPMEQARIDSGRNFSSQTAKPAEAPAAKPGFWKSWQAKAMEGKQEPMAHSYNEQKKLAEGDTKMRNAMLKKMFYKRNPLSPRNLIIKTLLGKDKSSFGAPPTSYRPRMFF